jgi:hypothetical protein
LLLKVLDFALYLLILSIYLCVFYVIVKLWLSKYSKVKLALYTFCLVVIITTLCYTISNKRYDAFAVLLIVIVNSLIYSYNQLNK